MKEMQPQRYPPLPPLDGRYLVRASLPRQLDRIAATESSRVRLDRQTRNARTQGKAASAVLVILVSERRCECESTLVVRLLTVLIVF